MALSWQTYEHKAIEWKQSKIFKWREDTFFCTYVLHGILFISDTLKKSRFSTIIGQVCNRHKAI